jgi:hypothetical protein
MLGEYLYNAYLKLRYKLFKKRLKKENFGTPSFVEDINNPRYKISHLDFYGDDMITLRDNVIVKDGKLYLHAKLENKEFSSWWGTAFKKWSIGWVHYQGIPEVSNPYGTWSVKCKLPNGDDNFPATWLLRERHAESITKVLLGKPNSVIDSKTLYIENWKEQRVELNWYLWVNNKTIGFIQNKNKDNKTITIDNDLPSDIMSSHNLIYVSPDHITPEVDFMEVIYGKLQQTLHYGYSSERYTTSGCNVKLGKPDYNKEYEFSVKIIKNKGYRFYIDGILTGVFNRKNAMSDSAAYAIINNAKNKYAKDKNSVFEIISIKYYKPS